MNYSCFFSGLDSNTGSKKMAVITDMKLKQWDCKDMKNRSRTKSKHFYVAEIYNNLLAWNTQSFKSCKWRVNAG